MILPCATVAGAVNRVPDGDLEPDYELIDDHAGAPAEAAL